MLDLKIKQEEVLRVCIISKLASKYKERKDCRLTRQGRTQKCTLTQGQILNSWAQWMTSNVAGHFLPICLAFQVSGSSFIDSSGPVRYYHRSYFSPIKTLKTKRGHKKERKTLRRLLGNNCSNPFWRKTPKEGQEGGNRVHTNYTYDRVSATAISR